MENLHVNCKKMFERKFLQGKHFVISVDTSSANEVTYIYTITDNILVYIGYDKKGITNFGEFNLQHFVRSVSQVISMECFLDKLVICFDTGHSVILDKMDELLKLDSHKSYSEEMVLVMSWSPTQEYILYLNAEYELVWAAPAPDFDIFAIKDLTDEDIASEFVTVGWGKRETQFRGSEGKFKGLQNGVANKANLDMVAKTDDDVVISWRGDGEYAAVGYFCMIRNTRKIKVYDKNGCLQYLCNLRGLRVAMDWRPSGGYINCIQAGSSGEGYELICVEKNCLKLEHFFNRINAEIILLRWNINSDILACLGKYCEGNDSQILYFYLPSNGVWFLKQEIRFKGTVTFLQWSVEHAYEFHAITSQGIYRKLEFSYEFDAAKGNSSHNLAFTNGRQIFYTPFSEMIIPSPASNASVSFEDSVNRVVFPYCKNAISEEGTLSSDCENAISEEGTLFAAITSKSEVFIIKKGSNASPKKALIKIGGRTLDEFATFANWTWVWPARFYFTQSTIASHYIHAASYDEKKHKIKITRSVDLEYMIVQIVICDNGLLVLLESDAILFCDENLQDIVELRCDGPRSERVKRIYNIRNKLYILTDKKNLCDFGGNKIFSNVLSVHYYHPFLYLLTSDYAINVINVHDNNARNVIDVRDICDKRALENGSKVVQVVGSLVVTQAPRGNLEIVKPAACASHEFTNLWKLGDYKNAFVLLKKEQIDANVMIGTNDDILFTKTEEIVRKIDSPGLLVTLVNQLKDDDNVANVFNACEILRRKMTEIDEEKYTLPILSTYVKSGRNVEALKYAYEKNVLPALLQNNDITDLYKYALATFDVNIAMKVAQLSDWDIREYQPVLEEINAMEEHAKKFAICKILRDHVDALRYHVKMDEKSLDLQYIRINSLHEVAINIFPPADPRYKLICDDYATTLHNNCDYLKAGIIYEWAENLEAAKESFLKGNHWREALVTAKKLDYDETAFTNLCEQLYNSLKHSSNYYDATEIARDFLRDYERAIECYCLCDNLEEALFVAEFHKTSAKSHEHITHKITMVYDARVKTLHDLQQKTNKYCERLAILRKPIVECDTNDTDHRDDDASSVMSMSSSAGSNTTARRRKKEARLWNLKEGNPREEMALLREIKICVEQFNRVVGIFKKISSLLLKIKKINCAHNLRVLVENNIKFFDNVIAQVWPASSVSGLLAGFDDMHLRCPPELCKIETNK